MLSNNVPLVIETPENLMYQLIILRDEINRLVFPVSGVARVFDEMTLNLPKFSPSELGFIRTVSWLYGLYYEAGKIGVNFLTKYLDVYKINSEELIVQHYQLVQKLRTFFGHNLDLNAPRDQQIITLCQKWFMYGCGSHDPVDEDHWRALLMILLANAIRFLEILRDCVRQVETDESKEMVYGQWAQKLKRYHPPHLFDSLIPSVLDDIGRSQMDPARLRAKYYSDWSKLLESYSGDYDFEVEARKLIEDAALSENNRTLPITGKDVMEKFNIPAGPRVGELLEKAKQIYLELRCDKTRLLACLADIVSKPDDALTVSYAPRSVVIVRFKN